MVHNGGFYFNTGSLDGNELIRQMLEVVISYEVIGIKIYGIVCDAGGGNESFFRMLCKYLPIVGPWIDVNCVRFNNPFHPHRYVYIWACSTHGLKALIHNLFRSQAGMPRSLEYNGIEFGWKQVSEIYLRDVEREKNNKSTRSTLV